MRAIATLVALTMVSALGAGCIENMRDLQDRMTGSEKEPVQPQALNATVNETTTPAGNVTAPVLKAPIARISVYAEGGALLYKASFVAENETSVLPVDEGSTLTVNAADSETREADATLAKYAWTLGAQTAEGRQATLVADAPGVQQLTLTVTDSNGQTDSQTIALGIAPAPFDVVTSFTTGPVSGAMGVGEVGTGTFDVVGEIDGLTVKAVAATVVASPSADCDAAIEVFDAEGESLGSKDSAGAPDPQTETLVLGELALGTYTVEVSPFACAAPGGVPVTITITYVAIVEGVDAGHGGHAH